MMTRQTFYCRSQKALLTLACALLTLSVMAQETSTTEKKALTFDDLIPGAPNYRRADNIYGLNWWGDQLVRLTGDTLLATDPKTGKETVLITQERLNKGLGLTPRSEGAPGAAGPGGGMMPPQGGAGPRGPMMSQLASAQFPWADQPYLLLRTGGQYTIFNFETDEVVNSIAMGRGENTEFNGSYSAPHVAYTVGNNLYVDQAAVTDEPEGVVCGQSVHRNEFGIMKGIFWSPKGSLLAFYRMDESMVAQYPLVDITQRIGTVDNRRYPMAGETSHKVQVGVYNPATGSTLYLNAGDPTDRYFTNIAWTPDEKQILLIELNRDQNHAKLCRYDATTGEPIGEPLYEEQHPKYVEPMTPAVFLPWDESTFVYQSQRDGYNHLYLFGVAGKEATEGETAIGSTYIERVSVKQLTQGDWLVEQILGFNAKKKEIYFSATKESPLQSNIYKVSVTSGKITRLDGAEGVHQASLSGSGLYFIDRYSTPTVPRVVEIVDTSKGKVLNTLLTAADPYEGYDMPEIEVGTIKADDGVTDLYYRLIKPTDFDPAKQYPVVVYVYGGPHAQLISNGWQYSASGWMLYMATKGCVVFTLDGRGSSNRGLEFENVTFRHLGVEECKDQIKGIEYLKSLPYVDGSRIGVHGWSFGGHMTTALMLRYPDVFKAGVAGGPVIDWQYYEVMYGERYMDTPQDNPEGYAETSLKNLAGNLKGRLLVIHDDHDDTCVPQHTLSFMKACVDARSYPDLFIYPNHPHNVGGRDRLHLYHVITRYFDDHLLGSEK